MIQIYSILIGIECFENIFYIVMKVVGKLIYVDYEVFMLLLEGVLNMIGLLYVKMLVDVIVFSGWELCVVWDDFKIGLKYGNEFEKIVIVGNKDW